MFQAANTPSMAQLRWRDPHPVGSLRVRLGVEMRRSARGAGPWDDLALAWTADDRSVAATGSRSDHDWSESSSSRRMASSAASSRVLAAPAVQAPSQAGSPSR